ncbi:MAG TPA: biotin--[acetyl-CoA-carboxylase] ligase [Actinomycetota bacterium]|nr:biotin--[acetyl-CoA-carboxylase] ligase [Actinomycetota bacterium]
MLDEDALRRAVDGIPHVRATVRWDDVTTSTNETAMRLASEGAPAWTLVAAAHQTRGRGRQGRSWVDRPGRALLCSVVLRPELPPDRLGLVSLASGAAIAGAGSTLSRGAVRCKWPNDLLAEGAKVGGVLAEAEVEGAVVRHVVVGFGVNLEVPEGVEGAGALVGVDPERLLAGSLASLWRLLAAPDEIPERWRAVADTLGRRVEATTVGGDAVRGVAADVDATGALVVETDGGPRRVAFGDVRHLVHDDG